ncbi:MAG: lytic murein transglycosylase [Alphaproteobacteria bacterium]|nr:lytic murein transglycosylase [Alphaproteobacteria bacterium]
MHFLPLVAAILALSPTLANATADQKCGGNFNGFVKGLKKEAVSQGFTRSFTNSFFKSVALDPKVIRMDRAQGVFKMTFTDFSQRVINKNRMINGKRNAKKYAKTFQRAEQTYGVDKSVILAFWALETDYGAVQGNFNTLNALVTLSHDCRRPGLFRPQIFSAMELAKRGDFDPATTTGAWAGEIGMVQMLPDDILNRGVDGDGDGHVRLKTSAPDAIMTAGRMLKNLGWRAGEPWLVEVKIPRNLNWKNTGLDHEKTVAEWAKLGVKAVGKAQPKGNLSASVLLPQGRKGPAFLALPNFRVYFEWNQSFVYVTTAAYFATRLNGAPIFAPGNPDPSLSDPEMKLLQTKLEARGYNVGKIDGILGKNTRDAVKQEQIRLGLPADSWPTKKLLNKL